MYRRETIGDSDPEGEASLLHLVLRPTVRIGDVVSVPMNIVLTSRGNHPAFPGGPGDYSSRSPGMIRSVTISPEIGWARFFIGSHAPEYSDLSAGNEPLTGFGFDLRPGIFRLAASTGISRRAIEPDSARGVRGTYTRRIHMAKIGCGSEDGSSLYLNAVRMIDDPGSISSRSPEISPQEGVLGSLNFRIGFTDNIHLRGEAGVSALTRDRDAGKIEGSHDVPEILLGVRASTQADYAGSLELGIDEDVWGIDARARYIGAGYQALGYSYREPDNLELTVAPRLRLFDNRVSASGSIGVRTNNLLGTLGATTRQVIGSIDLLAIITDQFSLTARYPNYGVELHRNHDTLLLRSVARSLGIAPAYTITTGDMIHTLGATCDLDRSSVYDIHTGITVHNDLRNIAGTYTAAFTAIPLTLSLAAGYTTNSIPSGMVTMSNISLHTGYQFFEGKVRPSLTLTWGTSRLMNLVPDRQLDLRLGMEANIGEHLALGVRGILNGYRYGGITAGKEFNERGMESSLSMRF